MKIFALLAVLVHLLFLLSVFYIYFQSPILKNLPVGLNDEDSVADRVVVFVADGLRAESFLKGQANRTKFLKEVILSRGAFGISHTRVPTESRPGHVALFAGIYEDPSAIFKGWKENPVEFDSVFNRSHLTFSWGSPDILRIFSNSIEHGKIYADQYSADVEDFSRSSNTSALDIWVFEKVKEFFAVPENRHILATEKKIILFLHLLGLDTSGHVHKPYSDLFSENLIVVDRGIQLIVGLVDELTNNDQKTAFIFTSDHGMTDRGSHGSGHSTETETPFVAWGAGIQYWRNSWNSDYSKISIIDEVTVPSWDINQADVTPLIASLLGLAVPKNNCGKLPRLYLNASEAYIAKSFRKNAEQLYQQYYHWRHKSSQKMFQWSLPKKEQDYVTVITKLRSDIDIAAKTNNYKQVISLCDILIDVTLEAIEYYHTYYKYELLFMISFAMIGWIMIVIGKLFLQKGMLKHVSARICVGASLLTLAIYSYNTLQGTPVIVTLYFILPALLWIPVLSRWKDYIAMVNMRVVGQTILSVCCSELCVASFFQRKVLSVFLVANTAFLAFRVFQLKGTRRIFPLITSNAILAIFPMLPVVEKDSNNAQLLIIGSTIWAVINVIVTIRFNERIFHRFVQFIICITHTLNMVMSVIAIENGYGLSSLSRMLSWILLASSFIVPLFTTTSLISRISAVIVNLAGPYMMLSLSYEPLFLLAFAISLSAWMETEAVLSNQEEQISKLYFASKLGSYKTVDFGDFRRSLTFVFYMLVSFFGTGNMATVSSFDPNWVRFFVSTFSPFLMAALIVLKLLIPILIAVCVLKSLQIITKVKAQMQFLLICIICELMCLNFFYLIKNKGSWLDIGSSISHFVIMECTTIVLILLYGCAKLLTEITLVSGDGNYPSKIRYMLPYNNKINKD